MLPNSETADAVYEIERQTARLKEADKWRRYLFFTLLKQMLQMHQEQRLAKNYEFSDRIRKMFNDLGMDIVQGVAPGKSYEAMTPAERRHPYREDTYVVNTRKTGALKQALHEGIL